MSLNYVPSGFIATRFGGWCSPLGVYFPRRANISADPILRSKGLDPRNHDKRFSTITDIALAHAWFQVDYEQRKMTNLREFDESKTAKRTFIFRYCPEAIELKQQRRIIAVAQYLRDRFEVGRNTFKIEAYRFNNYRFTSIPTRRDYEEFKPIEIETEVRTSKSYAFFRLDLHNLGTKRSTPWKAE